MSQTPSAETRALIAAERRLVAASFLYFIGNSATYFVGIIGLATYGLQASAHAVSALVVIINVVLVLASAAAGVVVDRIGPRITMVAACLTMAVGGLLPFLLPLDYPMLVAVSIIDASVAGVASAARAAYPRFLTDRPQELLKTNSWITTAGNVSVIVGPLIGGAITRLTGTSVTVFAVMTLVALPAAVVTWLTPELLDLHAKGEKSGHAMLSAEKGEKPAVGSGGQARGGFWREFVRGVRVTFSTKTLALILAVNFLGFFAYGAFDSLESIFYRDVLMVGNEWMGWLSAFSGIGATVGSLLVSRVPTRWISVRLVSTLLLVTGIGSVVYVGTSSVAIASIGQVISGFGFGAMPPVKSTLIQRNCDPTAVGRVSSVMTVGANSAGTFPLLVAPFIADAVGVQVTLLGASVFVAAVAVFFVAISGSPGIRYEAPAAPVEPPRAGED